jgi:hypothetical protein
VYVTCINFRRNLSNSYNAKIDYFDCKKMPTDDQIDYSCCYTQLPSGVSVEELSQR